MSTAPDDITLTSASAALLEPDPWHRRAIVYAICALVAGAVVWSHFTRVVQVSSGIGQVIPENQLQVVQSFDGGTVSAIRARRGDSVEEGQVIVLLDPVAAAAAVNEVRVQLAGLTATAAALRTQLAVVDGTSEAELFATRRLSPDGAGAGRPAADLPAARSDLYRGWLASELRVDTEFGAEHPGVVREAAAQFRTGLEELVKALSSFDQQMSSRRQEQSEVRTRLASTERSLGFASDQLAVLQKLKRKGAASDGELLASRAKVNDLSGAVSELRIAALRFDTEIAELEDRRSERLNAFRRNAATLLTDAETKRAALAANLPALVQRAERTAVRAPARGVLKSLNVSSVGQVMRAGDIIAEIVPADGDIVIQAKLKPEDIAFLAPGMPAIIRLTAYDSSLFGSVKGTLERIAADSTSDDDGNVYYLADVRIAQTHIDRRGERWPILPGMVASVDIVTGERSVLQYVTKPIHRMATLALRER